MKSTLIRAVSALSAVVAATASGTVNAQFTNLHDFSGIADSNTPLGGVAVSGTTVFGTTYEGGANDYGTLWSFVVPEPSIMTLPMICLWTLPMFVVTREANPNKVGTKFL